MYYLEAKHHGPADNLPIHWICLHGTVSPCVPGQARRTAQQFHETDRDASTQYIGDPGEIVRAVPDNVVAYGAPPNTGTIHIEQCDPQEGPGSRWQDANHQAMLHLVAQQVAALCTQYKIPVRKLSVSERRAGKHGIVGHKDVSDAFHQTTHVDPGPNYPWAQMIALIKAYQKSPRKVKIQTMQGSYTTPLPLTGKEQEVQVKTAGPSFFEASTDLRVRGTVGFHAAAGAGLLARVYAVAETSPKHWEITRSGGWEIFSVDLAGYARYSVNMDMRKGERLRASVRGAMGVLNEVWYDLETEAM